MGAGRSFLDWSDVQGARFEVAFPRRLTSSAARRPCLYSTRAIVASRWVRHGQFDFSLFDARRARLFWPHQGRINCLILSN